MQQNYNPNECQAAPVPQPVAQGQPPANYGTYQQPAPAPAPQGYYQQPAPAGQPANYGYGAPAGSPQPAPGQVQQQSQYTGYGTGGVVASHGTGSVVTGTGSLKGFAAGMNKLATGVALAFGNASGGRVVTPGGVAVAGNVPAGDGVCHFNQCRFFMKTGYCSGGHTLQCQEMNCAFYHHWVDPGHVHQPKPMQEVVVGQPVAPQPQVGSPQVLQTVPGTTTVPLGSGTQNGNLHGSGTVTLGSYGTGTAVVGAAPINDLAYTMNRAVTGVALAAGPASGGAVVSPSGAVVHGGDLPCGTGECHYNQCKFFMKSGYCVSGHTVQCRNQACPYFLQYCPPGHVCTQK